MNSSQKTQPDGIAALAIPIVQAPMAGGPSTPALAIAVCEAGGMGFVAAGYKRADAVAEEIRAVRAGTAKPFGVNLFVPGAQPADPDSVTKYLRELAPEAERQGVELGEPRFEDDDWAAKLDVVCAERPAVVSFTFGCPAADVFERLHDAGVAGWVTVTNRAEAKEAEAAGADGLVVQGAEAGGHRGGFKDDGSDEGGTGLLALLRLLAAVSKLPLIASGGIADGAALAAVLCAGASAGQIGTALMLAPEAGTADAQRARLAEPAPTRVTRAFTGRPARGIVNRFMAEHHDAAPLGYPEIHHVTSALRAAARKRGDADAFNLWAGQAHELAQARPAGEIVQRMAAEAQTVLARVSAGLRDPDTSGG
ncbi:MAG TPA: nitronate monooxygenase [Solirubrobacteraceae bacterium]|nr:nitronate monooxygenase [Solirubrobacteraceae bacterium]